VDFNTWSDPGTTAGWDGTNCTNTYCHSDGTDTATPTHANQNWTDNFSACTECHDDAGSDTTLSTAHADHTNATTNYDCDECHNEVYNASNVINDYTMHVNKVKDVDSSINYAGGGGACSSTNCHGDDSSNWTTDLSGSDNCTICHGKETSGENGSATAYLRAPDADGTGVDTGGSHDPTDEQVGAHQAHLQTPHNISSDFACTECHDVPGSVNASGHIDNALPAEIKFNGPMGTFNAPSTDYNYGTNRCSNTYCHNATRYKTALVTPAWANGTDYAPVWSNASYLEDVLTPEDCSMCHGWPPADSHPDGIDCSSCHDHVDGDDLGFTSVANISKHVDGLVQATGCDGCHVDTDVATAVREAPTKSTWLAASPATTRARATLAPTTRTGSST
jgi:predicted CxxxxCH...CXXCH cytochrome family protein